MNKTATLASATVSLSLVLAGGGPARGAGLPNVVVIMLDNHGWGELGVYGGGELRGAPTPRLDAFAKEGMQLLESQAQLEGIIIDADNQVSVSSGLKDRVRVLAAPTNE